MKETSIKAGVIGGLCGVFTFLVLFANTSKASVNESEDEFINMCKQIKGK